MSNFQYPIGIQLFNRPEYALELLKSLKEQTLSVNQSQLYIFIDGYAGSIYEARHVPDRTAEVANLARDLFPSANITSYARNHGIAALHNNLQLATFSDGSTWATFFEEDVVLDATYLYEIANLIEIVDSFSEIAKVACFQIVPELANLPRGFSGFYPGRGTQAFAERKSFFLDKQPLINRFLKLIEPHAGTEGQFNNSDISAELAMLGHMIPYIQHDSIIESYLESSGLLHVVTKPSLAKDIGVEGIHSYVTPQLSKYSEDLDPAVPNAARKLQLEAELALVRNESRQWRKNRLKQVFNAFNATKSRKQMLLRIIHFRR